MDLYELDALEKVLVRDYDLSEEKAKKIAEDWQDWRNGEFEVYYENEIIEALSKKLSEMIEDLGMDAFTPEYQSDFLYNYLLNDEEYKDLYIDRLIEWYNNLTDEEKDEELKRIGAKDTDDDDSIIQKFIYKDVYGHYYNFADYFFKSYDLSPEDPPSMMLQIDTKRFAEDYIDDEKENVLGKFLSTDNTSHEIETEYGKFYVFKTGYKDY